MPVSRLSQRAPRVSPSKNVYVKLVMDQPDPLIKIAVRGAGIVSAGAIIAMLAGKELAPGSWLLSAAGLILWASSEWDWRKREKKK